MTRTIVTLAILCLSPSTVMGSIIYVNLAATGANNGTSWTDARTDLRQALLTSTSGNEVWVAAGTYKPAPPNGSRVATFQLKNGVAVFGGFAGIEVSVDERNWVANPTILSGDLNSNDGLPLSDCCTAHQSAGCDNFSCSTSVCNQDPFCCSTLWDGQCQASAQALCAALCAGSTADNSYRVVASVNTLANTVFDGFVVTRGMNDWGTETYAGGLDCKDSVLSVRNCVFTQNRAITGGAITLIDSNVTIENCSFNSNETVGAGGAIHIGDGSSCFIKNTAFVSNVAHTSGGAIDGVSSFVAENCTFNSNHADQTAGVAIAWSQTTFRNCMFGQNSASNAGALLIGGQTRIFNCTIRGNFGRGIELGYENSTLTLRNSIVWQNTAGGNTGEDAQIHAGNHPVSIDYSCVQGWSGMLGGSGNTGADPLFTSVSLTDPHLNMCSPLIDYGDPAFVAGVDETDLDDEARVFGRHVDLGCDEVTYIDEDFDGIADGCDILGSCCDSMGSCTITSLGGCPAAWNHGGTCSPNQCPQPGSCCEGPEVCSIKLQADCVGAWTEGGSCDPAPCLTPFTASAVGSRYLSITVDSMQASQPMALRITSPDLPCIDAYVSTGGLVDSSPLFQTPAAWGTVYVGDAEIIPSKTYYIQTESQTGTSGVISATTWRWGDTNNSGVVDLDDILCELAAFAGNYSASCTLHGADLIGGFFNPDRVVNLDDILAVLSAFSGAQYPGPYPCP